MEAQKYNGQNVFILIGILNKPNIQLHLSPVHRQVPLSLGWDSGSIPAPCSTLTSYLVSEAVLHFWIFWSLLLFFLHLNYRDCFTSLGCPIMQFCHSQVYLRRYTAAFFFTCFPSFLFLFTVTEDYGTCYGEGVSLGVEVYENNWLFWQYQICELLEQSGLGRSCQSWRCSCWERRLCTMGCDYSPGGMVLGPLPPIAVLGCGAWSSTGGGFLEQ